MKVISLLSLIILASCSSGNKGAIDFSGLEDQDGVLSSFTPSSETSAIQITKNIIQQKNDQETIPKNSRENYLRATTLLKSRQFSSFLSLSKKYEKIEKTFLGDKKKRRFKILSKFLIKDLVCPPGKGSKKSISLIDKESNDIKKVNNFKFNPLIINIVTDPVGRTKSIDLWNNHERAVAYLKLENISISDIGEDNVFILVNGKGPSGRSWDHIIPSYGFKFSSGIPFSFISGSSKRSLKVSGRFTNKDLGSRLTIGKLKENIYSQRTPKIAVIHDFFDPIHEGYFKIIERMKKNLDIEEVILVPRFYRSETLNSKSFTHRLKMIEMRLKTEESISLFLGDLERNVPKELVNNYIANNYSTDLIYQILWSEEAKQMIEEGRIELKGDERFAVIPENDFDLRSFEVPANLRGRMEFLKVFPNGLPYTDKKVKDLIKRGKVIGQEIVKKDVLRYILDHNLYQRKSRI